MRHKEYRIRRPFFESLKGSCALPFPCKRKLPDSFTRSNLVLLYAFITKWDVFYMRVYRRLRSAGYPHYFNNALVLLAQLDTSLFKWLHVRPGGLEPPTSKLKASCSTD